jgi:hypothetical protein
LKKVLLPRIARIGRRKPEPLLPRITRIFTNLFFVFRVNS